MDTTSLTKRLKIEIDGWLSLGGIETSKEEIRDIKKKNGIWVQKKMLFLGRYLFRFLYVLESLSFFLQTMLST